MYTLLLTVTLFLQIETTISSSSYLHQTEIELIDNTTCPLWTKRNEKNGNCECEDSLTGTVYCSKTTFKVSVLLYHCMTYNEKKDKVLVGHCIFNYHSKFHYSEEKFMHTRINSENVSHLNYAMCHGYHRTGQMCGSCEKDYSSPAYSYSVACVKCKHYKYSWLKYISVAFLPLTVFYIIVILFRITITSGSLNGYILASQILVCPSQMRFIVVAGGHSHSFLVKMAIAFYGVWNLDVFRDVVYHPFCLHPKMTTLQVLTMDYLVAVYPLMLIVITYVFVKLHDRYSIVVRMWKPFYWCFARIRREWDISKSLIGAFATFLLLSYVKILYVSSDLLAPNILYNITGHKYSKLYLYYDGTYELFGKEHLPYAVLAIFMVTIFNIIPLVLLALYPCRCFQRCLNHCWPRRELFRTFVETFHGSFKLKPYDCRYFASLYLLLRFIVLIMYATFRTPAYYPIVAVTFFFTAVFVAIVRPYKFMLHTILDACFLLLSGMAFLWEPVYSAIQTLEPGDIKIVNNLSLIMLIPPIYGTGFVLYHVLPKKYHTKIVQCFKSLRRRRGDNEEEKEEEEFLSHRTKLYIESSPLLQEKKLKEPTN